MLSFSTQSLEYIPAQVTAVKAGVSYNPTADVVAMTFAPGTVTAVPASPTWYAASWDTAGTAYTALCLVGPGGTTTLTVGIWTVFVKVTDNPEVPVKNAGQIQMV